MSYKVKIIEKKDPIKQLEASKSKIKDLLIDLLNETKGFGNWINEGSGWIVELIESQCINISTYRPLAVLT